MHNFAKWYLPFKHLKFFQKIPESYAEHKIPVRYLIIFNYLQHHQTYRKRFLIIKELLQCPKAVLDIKVL
jgi:hypothetical protein